MVINNRNVINKISEKILYKLHLLLPNWAFLWVACIRVHSGLGSYWASGFVRLPKTLFPRIYAPFPASLIPPQCSKIVLNKRALFFLLIRPYFWTPFRQFHIHLKSSRVLDSTHWSVQPVSPTKIYWTGTNKVLTV